MDGFQIGLVCTVIGCFVGLAGWLSGRDKKLQDDSKWRGEVSAKLDMAVGIKGDVQRIERAVVEQGKEIAAQGQSIKQAHHRIDALERKDD